MNSYLSNEKIFEILEIISRHQKLERNLDIILKGEKFKIMLFLFLLPLIVGGIGGLFPIFNILLTNLNQSLDINYFAFRIDTFITFTGLLISVLISSNYFVRILKNKRKLILICISSFLFLVAFFISFLTVETVI
jgi:hypothetical protein